MKNEFLVFLKDFALKKKLVPMYLLIVFIITITSIISLIRPKYQGLLIDKLSNISTINKNEFFYQLAFFFIILISGYLIAYIQRYFTIKISEEIGADLRKKINSKLGTVKSNFFETVNFSDILLKSEKDIQGIKQCGITSIITLVSYIILLGSVIPYMFHINKVITIINVLLLTTIPFISKKMGGLIQKTSKEVLERYNFLTNILNDNYFNWAITRIFNCHNYVNKKYENENNLYKNSVNHQNLLYIINSTISITIQFLGTVIIWVICSKEIFEGKMTIGTIMALMSYQSIIMGPILGFSNFVNEYHTSIEALKDLYSLYNYEDVKQQQIKLESSPQVITLNNMSYHYKDSDKDVLRGITVEFNRGHIYAIVGKSGQGKSTLFKLLAGILNPTDGEILIDGENLKNIDLNSYWNELGYVMQPSKFFKDSILKNLDLSNKSSKEDIENICIELDLNDHINSLENKWNTSLNTEISNFSEGQLKRLDIARNVLKKPSILIFDEATANIDEKRRYQFYNLMRKLSKESIIVLSTHRKEDLNYVDTVYELCEAGLIEVLENENRSS